MYNNLIGEKITIIVSTRGEHLLEYTGTLLSENEEALELANVEIKYFMIAEFAIHKQMFGDAYNKGRNNIERLVLNKRHIISCNK